MPAVPTGDLLDLHSPTPSGEWGDTSASSPSLLESSEAPPHHFPDDLDFWGSPPGTADDMSQWGVADDVDQWGDGNQEAQRKDSTRDHRISPLYGDPFSHQDQDVWRGDENTDFW